MTSRIQCCQFYYNMQTHTHTRPVANYVTSTVETVLALHREERNGDVLAFLTGQEEVDVTVSQLRWVWPGGVVYVKTLFFPENMPVEAVKECSCCRYPYMEAFHIVIRY